MPSSISLPSELWFDIVQDLKLRDLLTLCESFRGTAHAHVEVVSRQRAEEPLYSIFTTSQVKAQFYIGSNGIRLIPYSKYSKRGYTRIVTLRQRRIDRLSRFPTLKSKWVSLCGISIT